MEMTLQYGDQGIEDAIMIRRKVFMEEQQVSEAEELDGRDDRSFHLTAYVDDKPVGCTRFYEKESGIFVVGRVAVLAEYRHRGIGQAMVRYVEKWAREPKNQDRFKINVLQLDAQDPVIPFYQALGYDLLDMPGFLDAGIPHHKMELRIQEQKDA